MVGQWRFYFFAAAVLPGYALVEQTLALNKSSI